ncbi:hypothetical protein K1X76_03790 [bacterium]|nr:hypothetical protein [bacterium]
MESEEKALKMIHESQIEFENHPFWKKAGVTPKALFEATREYVAKNFNMQDETFKKKYEKMKDDLKTRSVEKSRHYMDGHKSLKMMAGLRV